MFALYCDDSGTHPQSDYAVAACFVSTHVQWTHFRRDWGWANEIENFGVFHMADFVAKKKQFALPEWQDEEKRDRTLKRLINVITTRARHGFYAAVEKAAYDEEVPEDIRERFRLGKNHYTFAVRMCMAKVLKWRQAYGHKEPIEFVFDQMSKGSGDINSVFEEALKDGEQPALQFGISRNVGWSFRSKADIWPLQAADILAWESLYYMKKVFLPKSSVSPRGSYRALQDMPMGRGYHDRDSLRSLIAHLRSKITATTAPE